RRGIPVRVAHQFHQEHAFLHQVGGGDANAGAGQAEQRVHLGVLPILLLNPAAVASASSHGARIAAAASLAPLLVLRELVKPALLGLLVDLGAPHLAAAGDDVHRRLLAALEAAYYGIDHAVIDQRLQALGD